MLYALLLGSALAGSSYSESVTVKEAGPTEGSLELTDGRTVVLYATEEVEIAPGTYALTWTEEAGTRLTVGDARHAVAIYKNHPIDRLQSACIEKDPSTAGMHACMSEATRRWDLELNRVYKHLMTTLDPETKAALQKGQRAWIPYRDGEIGLIQAHYGRRLGSMYGLLGGAEIQALTSSRTKRLWELAAPEM